MGVSSLPLHVDHAHAKHTHERTTPYRDARLSASSIPLHKTLLFWQDLSPTFFSIKKELDWTATEIRQQCSLRARFCSDTLFSYHCCSSLTSWDPRDGRCIRTAKLFNGKPTLVQTLRSGKHVVVCGHFMEIYVVDAIQFRVSARTIVCSQ